jgi:transcriptional regulator with XRE-family HTH domain
MSRPGTGGLDELSRTLRELRKPPDSPAAHLTLEQAATNSGLTISKINRIERGKTIPTPEDAVRLAKALGAPPPIATRLEELARAAKAGRHRVVLSRSGREVFQKRLGDLDKASAEVKEFSPVIIPGLLQSSEYMWAIAATGTTDQAVAAAFVRYRLARQALLDEPGRLTTILTTEGALGWAGGVEATVMLRQLDHIAAISHKPYARVGIIPFGVQTPVFPVSTWTLYDERAVVPGILGYQTVLTGPDVRPYVAQYEQLAAAAAYDDAAREILAGVAERYRRL